LISLYKVSNKLWEKTILKNITWEPQFCQSWAILGPNGAGKSTLIKVILGQLPYCGTIKRDQEISSNNDIAYTSLDQQKLVIAKEEKKYLYESFSGTKEYYLSGYDFINPKKEQKEKLSKTLAQLGIDSVMEKPIRNFSNGEMRKTLIVKALLGEPKLLILDEPFEGLDSMSAKWLSKSISKIIKNGLAVWLISNRTQELVPEISHILCLKSGKILMKGLRSKIYNAKNMEILYSKTQSKKNTISNKEKYGKLIQQKFPKTIDRNEKSPCIIQMKDVSIRFGERVIFKKFNWSIFKDENWKIIGPNGSGKSTLLNLISGDNLQVYSNKIFLFGKRRGTGESIWDIKQKLGLVSPELHFRYKEPITAMKVILSGFFDSIGFYQPASKKQKETALNWMNFLNIENFTDCNFNQLSFGQQRLILIARSMVKSPQILILDEPCGGLDKSNRNRVLELIDHIGMNSTTQIIYISHFTTDELDCMDFELRLKITENGISRPQINKIK